MNGTINNKTLDVSWGTLLKISLVVLFFYVLYLVRDILLAFVFALIISILFDPIIDFLQRFKIPRVLAVILVYVVIFGFLAMLIYYLAPILIHEINQFAQLFPYYFEKISPPLKVLGLKAFENIEVFSKTLENTLSAVSSNIFASLFAVFGGIFSTLFIISIAIFLSLEEKGVLRALQLIFPSRYEDFLLSVWQKCEKKVSGWFLSRIIASSFVAVASIILFYYFNVKYPFSLGIISGLLNFIPIIGPMIAASLVFFLVAIDSILRAIFVIIGLALIQQIENNILTPFLSKKLFDLPPVIVLISLALGMKLAGFLGAILGLPLAAIIYEFVKDFLEAEKRRQIEA
jgi:predicted PurR-regulated permease PerM